MKKKRLSILLLTCFAMIMTTACGETNSLEDSLESTPTSVETSEMTSIDAPSVSVVQTYNCVVVNDTNGVVTVNKDSAQVDEEIVLTIKANEEAAVVGIQVNDNIIYEGDLDLNEDGSYTYVTTMITGGLQVKGLFVTDNSQVRFTIQEMDTPAGFGGEIIDLPEVRAYDSNGVDLTKFIEMSDETDPNATLAKRKFYSDVIGTHTIKYVVKNPSTNNILNETTVQANVYLRVLADSTVPDKIVVEDEMTNNPVLYTLDQGISALNFNFEKGKYYYAEVQMDPITEYSANQIIGISHNMADNATPQGGMYYNGFKFNASGFELAHSKYITDWGHVGSRRMWMSSNYATRDGQKLDITTNTTKLAIARINEDFYTFINDKFYSVAQYEELLLQDTYPGLVFYGHNSLLKAKFRKFHFIKNQDEIVEKVNSLKATSTFDYLDIYDNSVASNFAAFDVENGFRYKNEAATLANNNMNNSMVTPYVHLYGREWKISFNIKTDAIGDNGNWGKVIFDVRTLHDFKSVFNWALTSSSNGEKITENIIDGCEVGALYKGNKDITTGVDFSKTIKVQIDCGPQTTENQVRFFIHITDANGNHNYNHIIIAYTSTASYLFDSYYLVFHSQKWAGTISNFKVL